MHYPGNKPRHGSSFQGGAQLRKGPVKGRSRDHQEVASRNTPREYVVWRFSSDSISWIVQVIQLNGHIKRQASSLRWLMQRVQLLSSLCRRDRDSDLTCRLPSRSFLSSTNGNFTDNVLTLETLIWLRSHLLRSRVDWYNFKHQICT